ncbi:XrtB/PEP-CTERM-associated polysaccharide biosynthesis outer membrane protein EpsL [Massilia sp. CF038]|uniref:XrtB/PEP-CTERM-associated polysaccharide biosynthesis outer membrane protein EpsL n=1 Tax=Massilia sp. CF038 TaxID=1881045 RepID=UPI0009133602|nr:XrtB/PEP-CTERM-associated polysaccharide biosynthesis outer membrane protein EpsL [Massilia sp. CF038]SHH12074.1 exopolysaccharide biosynthesis operon protein EpsL [Massilia sp. CF038]
MKSDTAVRAACCAQLLGALTSLPALAAPEQVVRPYVGYALTHEDNLLGADEGVNGGAGAQSTSSRQASAGVLVDKRISQQALSAALNFTNIRYDQLPELDHNAHDLRANWNWRVGEHVDGNIGASYVKALAPFVNFHGRERNLRAERRQFADGGYLLHPSWRVRAGASRSDLEHELLSQKGLDRIEQMSELGLDYLARSGSTVGTQLRHTTGRYPFGQQVGALLVDNSYTQDELKIKVNWLVTRKSQLQFLGGPVRRKHDDFPARDYSGLNARLQANSMVSGKVTLAFGAWREIGAIDDITASYTLNQGVNLGTIWNASDKVRVDALFKNETSQYSGLAGIPATAPEREDRVNSAVVKLQYRATAHLRLAGQAFRTERRSTQPGNSYPSSGLQMSLKYEF